MLVGLWATHSATSSPCPASQYEAVHGTDSVCLPLTNCTRDEFEQSPPTLTYAEAEDGSGAKIVSTADRVCRTLTTCTSTQWETKAAGPRHDRVCQEHTQCAADGSTREAWHASTHHDRECAAGQVCSHVTCTHAEHDCPTHRAYKALRHGGTYKNPCDLAVNDTTAPKGPGEPWMRKLPWMQALPWAGGTADGRLPLPIASIRVWHHGKETTCSRGAVCQMRRGGSGVAAKCICTQRFPTRPDAASCQQQPARAVAALASASAAEYRRKASCFRHCRATGEATACAAAEGFVDTQPPIISSCGTPTEFVNRWSHWRVCRTTAVDGVDGDVTSAIRYDVSGPLSDGGDAVPLLTNANLTEVAWLMGQGRRHVGRYELSIRVCDASDNCATARQRIIVHEITSRLSCRHLQRSPTSSFLDAVGDDDSVCSVSFCGYQIGRYGDNAAAGGPAGKRKTFVYAREHCRRHGARLCTYDELRRCGSACLTGCEHAEEHVWTSSFSGCDNGGHVVAFLGDTPLSTARVCKDDQESFGALRCCADRHGYARFFAFYKGWNIVPQDDMHTH